VLNDLFIQLDYYGFATSHEVFEQIDGWMDG